MAILVTGGAGFIGSHVVARLLESGREVICVDDFNDFYDPRIKRGNVAPFIGNSLFSIHDADIRDREAMEKVFSASCIDTVLHLAARAGVRPSLLDPLLYADVNIGGTLALLELCRKRGVAKFIFGSSSSVYGKNDRIPFSEEDRVDAPVSPYAVTKRVGELLSHAYHKIYAMSVCCLRFFTVYGPRQRPDMAIHKFTRMIAEGRPISMYGDGTSSRDYTYIDDIVDGVAAATGLDFGYEIINLGDSKMVELWRLIALIETSMGVNARVERLPDQPGDVPRTCADISKAKNILGYVPKVSIEEGVPRFVEWFMERQAGRDG